MMQRDVTLSHRKGRPERIVVEVTGKLPRRRGREGANRSNAMRAERSLQRAKAEKQWAELTAR